jgi:hypothetical protein
MRDFEKAERLAEETLKSLDQLQPVEVNDFLFTRIKSRMATQKINAMKERTLALYRLSALLLLFLVINVSSYYWFKHEGSKPSSEDKTGIKSFSSEYHLQDTSYDY